MNEPVDKQPTCWIIAGPNGAGKTTLMNPCIDICVSRQAINKQASDPGTVQTSLRKSVQQALERKRRLGQYAVIWREGKPVRVQPGPIPAGVQESGGTAAYDVHDRDAKGRKQT